MSLSEHLEARREVILEKMFEYRRPDLQTPAEHQRQFHLGYFNLVAAAAAGDDGVRDEYLQAVVPGIKAAGLSLGVVMDGMVRVATIMVSETDKKHHDWLIRFNADYTFRLSELWDA